MVFDQFDRIRIINLPHRSDRRREMDRQLALAGIKGDPKIAYFPAIRPETPGLFGAIGPHGCFLSHFTILQEALAAKESVLVIEDDCDFTPLAKTFRKKAGTRILYGGYNAASDESDLINSDIIGSHFMGFSADVLPKLVQFLQSLLDPASSYDPAVVRSDFDPAIRPPIDGAYIWFRRYNPDIVTEFASLGFQRSSATDIGDRKWFDRIPALAGPVNLIRRMRRIAR